MISKTNFFVITQFLAHKNNLPHMFQRPLDWCKDNINKLGVYFFEENHL